MTTPCPRPIHRWSASAALLFAALCGSPAHARAPESFVYLTNWFAQAGHGGFYQAVAEGTYAKYGLDVTIRMGGPQVNIVQLMAAGQADGIMGSSDIQMMQTREAGVPVVNVAAFFQKDPQVLIAHSDVARLEDLKGKTILLDAQANRSYWPWLKARYGLTDEQTRPYTFNIQPFLVDRNTVQQGYLTSEPYAIEKASVKSTVLMFSDFGYPAYATTVSCLEKTLAHRGKQVAAFVKASAEGWKSYLADPAPGNALIRKDNPAMTDDQLAYGVARLKATGMVTDARSRASYDFLVGARLLDPSKVALGKTYTTDLVRDAKVLP